ncbi:MAG: hypothetical protein ACFB12_06280 [Leptolyngbyaceae cyanobacterium]
MYSLFQLVYVIAHRLVEGIQPVLVPLCFVIAWATLIAGSWSVWAAMRDGVKRAQRMHQIPCADCQYFSGSYLLKCPLHPKEALSEAAIACRDFESAQLEWPKSSP